MTAATVPARSTRRRLPDANRWALSLAGIGSILVLWAIGGSATRYVPPIGEVLSELPGFLASAEVWDAAGVTTLRVIGSLLLAMVLGAAAAAVMRRDWFWGRVMSSFVGFAIAVPSTVAALLALYVFRRDPIGVYAVVAFICFPFVATVLREGMRNLDVKVGEMGDAYRITGTARLRHVVLPQLAPYGFSAVRNEYAHAWKIVVLAELFIGSSGMGWQFARAFDRFQLTEVVLWLLVFVAILLLSEYLVIRPLERFVLKWRVS
ncbi:ABC transporter permease [Geodermatophilus sabuli]|uniref:NitT/TauT family transport system permease protein n=1 Tax=Geodermatophilus sabuli TaxID=1564158 RepID=A0A285EBQ2_9ACTN|nr:ABC transporter permease subunit [Geodermatophilus sabuli]MBB3085289.1 NitT/TauT family transport system permease protein [Geodermatophilus sabuli]SNX96283.1 NitT/TauT family transport system permease protein [Geodermatophilus sabuli]